MIYTIGHSNRSSEELLQLLTQHGIRRLIDVRRYPVSRRFPHFSRDALGPFLTAAGLDYRHAEPLGGHRDSDPRSPHLALDPKFRGYADHLATPTIVEIIDRVVRSATRTPTACMCAEADPAHCHRSLLADAFLAREAEVMHIVNGTTTRAHRLHPAARVVGTSVIYDGTTMEMDFGDS